MANSKRTKQGVVESNKKMIKLPQMSELSKEGRLGANSEIDPIYILY